MATEANQTAFSQTLSRGITLLEVLAGSGTKQSLRQLVDQVGLPRSVVYRLLRTLQAHRLVRALPDGQYDLGLGLFALSRGVGTDVREVAKPVLERFAETMPCTAVLNVVDGDDVVCMVSVEPSASGLAVLHREGRRHPLGRGASGIAASAAMPARTGERAAVGKARRAGFAASHAEVVEGTVAASAPLRLPSHDWVGAVSLLFVESLAPPPGEAGRAAIEAARLIEEALKG